MSGVDRLTYLDFERASTRSTRTAEMAAAREPGGALFEAVFSHDVRACLRSSLDEASRREHTGLRLRLRLQDAPRLADLPWEFLFDSSLGRFLAQRDALRPLREAGRVQIDWMEDATLTALQHRLRAGRYHIFHFIGHGGYDERTEEGRGRGVAETNRNRLAGDEGGGVIPGRRARAGAAGSDRALG
jgi:hypothetical protein